MNSTLSKESGAILKASDERHQQQSTTTTTTATTSNPRVLHSTSTSFTTTTTTTTTTALYTAAIAKVDMILPPPASPTSSSSTVLAWLQKELSLYVDLHLMSIPLDLTGKIDWLAKPIVCLAHRYFPDQFLSLAQQLRNPTSSYKKALQVFEDRLNIVYDKEHDDISTYLTCIRKALLITDDQTLRDLRIRDSTSDSVDFDLAIGVPLTQLWQQWSELAKQESLSTTASMRSSPSPRIEPFQSRDWEDIGLDLQQMQPQYQSFQQAIITNTDIPPDLAVRISAIDATHAALSAQIQRPTIEFDTIIADIRNELEFIQAKMLNTTTTDVGIHDLEVRSTKVGTLIDNLVRHDMDDGQHEHYQVVLHKYQLIVSWVDDVRVWFVEAERIRGWIELRIQQLEEKQSLNALEKVEYDYTPQQIHEWNQEHAILQRDVEEFNAQDMTRLRAHVKQLPSANKDLSPADTTTIEITFTTLRTLDRLMHLLRRHAYELQMLTLRMVWEESYHETVAWIRFETEQVKQFVHQQARWRVNDDDGQKDNNNIINALITFEQRSTHFDQNQFTNTVNAYQDLDEACHVDLPNHLESRQIAIEEGFEELTHRIAFARQVVEQRLFVTDFLAKADQLKKEGEVLRQEIVTADVSAVSTTELSEKVVLFQESTARLVTGVVARVPCPETTRPSDQQVNDDANVMIRTVIGSRKTALVLFGDALDHNLSALRRALQLQKRTKQLQDEMTRLSGWVDERLKAMDKSKVDVFVAGKCALDETDLARLIKERDGQVTKLKGITENEFGKLQDSVLAVQQSSSSQHNMISSQVSALQNGLGTLGNQLEILEGALQLHSSRLAILGRRISWETQHAKASLWLSNNTFAVWDFVSRKAQWRVNTVMDYDDEDKDRTIAGSNWRSQAQQECKDLVVKLQAFHTDQLNPVDNVYNELVSDFELSQKETGITTSIEYVQRRQDTLSQSYRNLNDLIHYAQQVLDQHGSLTYFTHQAGNLQTKGNQIKFNIQQAIESVMILPRGNHHLDKAVQEFNQHVIQLWAQSGSQLPYPVCSEDARTTRPSTNDDGISTEVATAVYKTYTDLQALSNALSEMVQRLDIGLMYRVRLEQWCLQVQHTTSTIIDVESVITSYSFDLTSGTVSLDDEIVDQGKQLVIELEVQCRHCQNDVENVKQQLLQIQTAIATDECNMLDLSITEKPLALLEASWNTLDQSIKEFKNHMKVCEDRAHWYTLWLHQSQTLSGLQEAMLEWINQKTLWISTFDGEGGGDETLQSLAKQLQDYIITLESCFLGHDALKNSYNSLLQSFKVATGTALEDSQQSNTLQLSSKLQESMDAQLAEIRQIQERHDWTSRVDEELKACTTKGLATESFIQLYARWSPSTKMDLNLTDKVEKLHQATAAHVAAMDALLNQVIQQQTEPIFRRKANLESTKHCLEQQDLFLNKVIEQQKALFTIVYEINHVEALAESKKSVLLSLSQPSLQDLDEYKQRMDKVNTLIGQTMIYPVRHYRDHNPRDRELDTSHNAGLQDMLKARQSRLTELGFTLESISKSNERLSRRKAAEASYFAEANVVDGWIDAKNELLNNNVQDLKSAVAHINALQSAITNYTASVQGLQVSASKYIAVIQQQQGDDDVDDTAQSAQRIHDKQAYIDIKWHQLEGSVSKVQQQRRQNLRHQEFMSLLLAFNTQCDELQEELQQDVGQMTEAMSTQWQDELQALDTKLSELKLHAQRPEDAKDARIQYDTLKEQVHLRSTEANHYRLKQDYAEGATDLELLIASAHEAFKILAQKPAVLQGDVGQDRALLEDVNSDYNACCQLLDQEKYDEQRSFYRFLQLNKVSDLQEIDDRQSQLEKQWKQIKQELANYHQKSIKSLLQWQELHSKLNDIKEEALEGVQRRLDRFELSHVVPAFLDQDASLLVLLKHRAAVCLDTAASLPQEDDNMIRFKEIYDGLIQQVDTISLLLSEKRTFAQQHVDMIECEQLVGSFCSQIAQEVEAIQTDSISDSITNVPALESLYTQASTTFTAREAAQQAFKHQLNIIESRIDVVSKKYNVNNTKMQQDLKNAMCDLNAKLADTVQVNDVMRRVLDHSKTAEHIRSGFDHCQTAIADLKDQDESTAALDLASLTQKMSDFKKAMQSFLDLSQEAESIQCDHDIVHQMVDHIVKPTTRDIKDQWQKTQTDLKLMQSEIEKTTRGLGAARKMNRLMALVKETKEYLEQTRLYDYDSNTDIADKVATDKENIEQDETAKIPSSLTSLPRRAEVQGIEKRMKATESEIIPQAKQELNELDTVMPEFDADVTFTKQHHELKESVKSLLDMFAAKYATLEKSIAIGTFLSTADDIEILQSSLEEAVSQSAPHHSLIGTFGRTDLQAKLIELDARFRCYERQIVPSLALAQEQANSVAELTVKGGEAVQQQLQEMDSKWMSIKKQFKTRKIDLSRTSESSQDSKDQHARIRKSSLPTRKASSLLRDRADTRQRLSPTASSTSSSSSSSRTTRLPSRFLTPPPHQPSKSATHLKPKTTITTIKPPLNSYVADPKNDLDIEIGRIVNETPYRVKVKMVPGEVGRYWFGNMNPKLAYCRVLKSKMVMVRVGGGWTELSQFLRDHALLEGDFIPRLKKKNAAIPEEDEPKSPTFKEGFIETHKQEQRRASIGNITGSPSHSASSTTSGYKEGDRFIAVDSHGNQLQVQMRKASNNFMHTSSSSSTTNTSGGSLSSSILNDYTQRRIARRNQKKVSDEAAGLSPSPSPSPSSK